MIAFQSILLGILAIVVRIVALLVLGFFIIVYAIGASLERTGKFLFRLSGGRLTVRGR